MSTNVQYVLPRVTGSSSATPIITSVPAWRAAAHRRSVIGPGTSTAAAR